MYRNGGRQTWWGGEMGQLTPYCTTLFSYPEIMHTCSAKFTSICLSNALLSLNRLGTGLTPVTKTNYYHSGNISYRAQKFTFYFKVLACRCHQWRIMGTVIDRMFQTKYTVCVLFIRNVCFSKGPPNGPVKS